MENFKLLQLVPSMHSGGVEQGTIDLANFLSEKKFFNYIASSGGRLLKNIKYKNTQHIDLPLNSKFFFKYPFLANKLQTKIDQFGINVIHFRSRAPAWLLPFLSKKNILSVSTFHNVYGNENIIKSFYNKQLGNVNSIVAISEYVKNEIIKQYGFPENKITVINRGCDIEFFKPNQVSNNKINKIILENKIPFNKKIILFPGRITEWKGQIEFLEVIKFFKEKDLFFIFVGDTKNYSFANKFLKKIKDYNLGDICKVIDNVSHDDLRTMYFMSKIVISAPLKPEGFGRIISESLLMKKIILAYNFGGAKDQLHKLNDLYKVEPKNIKMLIKKINIALNLNAEEHENISNESRLHIIKYFSKQNMLSKYLDLYLNL